MLDTLTPNKLKAATLIAQGNTGKEVAKSCNVTPQTISEWQQIPDFKALINSIKMEALESARDKLQSASQTAVQALVDLAKNETHPETQRKAALNILEMTGFTRETIEMFAWGIDSVVTEETEHEEVTETVSELAALLRTKIANLK